MKKILATLILSFMILTLLVGCTTPASQNNNNSDSQNTDNNSGGSGSEENNSGGSNAGNNGSQGNQGAPDIEETPPEYIGGEHPGGVGGEITDDEGDEGQQPGAGTDVGEENQGGGGTSTPGAEGGVLPEEGGNTEDAPIEGGVVTPTLSVGTNVGDLFGDVKLETISGGVVDTADYRGKILIVNIWATWCPPCKAELPDFNRIASEYADDVVIIAAHTPSGNGNALSYVNTNFPETNIIFAYDTVYSDAYLAAGGDEYVPQTAIIDQNGVIIYSDSGLMTYSQVMAIIEAYL